MQKWLMCPNFLFFFEGSKRHIQSQMYAQQMKLNELFNNLLKFILGHTYNGAASTEPNTIKSNLTKVAALTPSTEWNKYSTRNKRYTKTVSEIQNECTDECAVRRWVETHPYYIVIAMVQHEFSAFIILICKNCAGNNKLRLIQGPLHFIRFLYTIFIRWKLQWEFFFCFENENKWKLT